MNFYHIIQPLVFTLPAEVAHVAAVNFIKYNFLSGLCRQREYEEIAIKVFGIDFSNPVGLAAGFDKNADLVNRIGNYGFGFAEVGTVTPKPQSGNPKPRLFRLTEDEAVINRMGFNNKGMEYFLNNLKGKSGQFIIGANIGKNKDSIDAIEDYLILMENIYGYSNYITVNISSPNTPGLRDLQHNEQLNALLAAISDKKKALINKTGKNIPVLLKIAPDTDYKQREDIAEAVLKYQLDGIIVSNTTIGCRDNLKSIYKNEQGGLSGRPLFNLSTEAIMDIYKLTKGQIPIIGAGGISSAEDAYAKIKAGSTLVQLYSALVYNGMGMIEDIKSGLIKLLKQDGFTNITQAIGKAGVR